MDPTHVMHTPLSRRRWLAALLVAPALAPTAFAQAGWPSAPIRIVVPLPAGGGVDVFARALAEQLQAALGQTVIVDNKPGAGGLLGTKAAAQAVPDGHTLAYVHSGLVTVQAMNPRLDLLKELRPVAKLTYSPFVVAVSAASKYRTLQDLVADVQARPGKVSYGSGGIGSPAHLAVEHLGDKVGNFKALHVPFKGAIEAANAIAGGQVDFQIGLVGGVAGLLQGGKLRALAVTSRAPLPQLPGVPTMAEAGVKDFVFEPWGGLAAPAGTPDAVLARLAEVLPRIMAAPAIKELMARQAGIADYVEGPAFGAQIAREVELDRVLVKRLGMTTQ